MFVSVCLNYLCSPFSGRLQLRYANCSGSSEAGSTEQMFSLTSFSKHLLKMGVRATGLQSFKHVILFFFGMGTMVDFLKHEGTTDRERDRLKMSVKTQPRNEHKKC